MAKVKFKIRKFEDSLCNFERIPARLEQTGYVYDTIESFDSDITQHTFYNDVFYVIIYTDRKDEKVKGVDLCKFVKPGNHRSSIIGVATTDKDEDFILKGLMPNWILSTIMDVPNEEVMGKLQELSVDYDLSVL